MVDDNGEDKTKNIIPLIRDKTVRDMFKKRWKEDNEVSSLPLIDTIRLVNQHLQKIDKKFSDMKLFLSEQEYRLKMKKLEEERDKSNYRVFVDYRIDSKQPTKSRDEKQKREEGDFSGENED